MSAAQAGNGPNGELSPVVVDALCKQLVTDLSSTLVNKEEALWKRGQAELKKLQQEHQLQLSAVQGRLQEVESRQHALLNENAKMKEALMDVTSKFEFVVLEMREALRGMPRRPGVERSSPCPSVVSTAASDCRDLGTSPGVTEASTALNSSERPLRDAGESPACDTEHDSKDADIPALQQLWTPPRGAGGEFSNGIGASSNSHTAATPGGTVLSLAAVLPDANTNTPSKPLHLAEHLEQHGSILAEHPLTNGVAPGASPSISLSNIATPGSSTTFGNSAPSPFEYDPRLLNCIELVKELGSGSLGIEVHQADDASLRIDDIEEDGLVGLYNARLGVNSMSRVLLGDRIIDVNGISGDPSKMLEECKLKQRLTITLARNSSPDSLLTSPQAMQDVMDGSGTVTPGPRPGSPLRSSGLRAEASIFVPNFSTEAPMPHHQGAPPGLEPPALDAVALLTTVSTPTVPPYIPAPPPNPALMDMALLMAGRQGLPNTEPMANAGYVQKDRSSAAEHEQLKRALFS